MSKKDKTNISSLSSLKKVRIKNKSKDDERLEKILDRKNRPKPEEPEHLDDENLFASAMSGVERLNPDQGRQVAEKPVPPEPMDVDPEEFGKRQFQKFMRGEIEFDLEYTDEYMQGQVKGLDSKIFRQLKSGGLSVEAHLDMHGLNAEQAYEHLLFFVRESYLQGYRCLLLITGRGKNSPGGYSVLKQAAQDWLTKEPLRKIVLGFCTALPKDGGAGALYVLLRKQKKSQGKVKWDKMINWERDL